MTIELMQGVRSRYWYPVIHRFPSGARQLAWGRLRVTWQRWFFAYMGQGNCWKWKFSVNRYANGCTHYIFWRLLLSVG